MDLVLAEQPEVHVANFAGVPMVKEMLAVRLDLVEHCPVDPLCVSGESTLGARDLDRATVE